MKKVIIFLFAAVALAVSCQVEQQIAVEEQEQVQQEENLVYKTFTVSMPTSPIDPETKTYLYSDGHAIYWSADDEIAVIEVANKVKRTFTLKSGAGTANAVFEGSVSEDATGYYAYYPNVDIKTSSLPTYIEPNAGLASVQRPVIGGYDKNFALMTAVADGEGNFAFRHGVAYFKLTIPRDDVTSVKLTTAGSRFNGRPQFTATTGISNAINSPSSDMVLAPVSGTFTEDATYYIPVLYKSSNTGNLTVEYTYSNGSTNSKTSTSLSKVRLEAGKIYNLGSLDITPLPQISAANVEIGGDDTAGSIAYALLNPASGSLDAEVTSSSPSSWLTLGAVGVSSVAFTCEANDTGANKTATVRLTYTYDTDKTVTKDVTVTQTIAGSYAYTWDFSTSAWQTALTAQASDACLDTNGNNNVTFDFSYDGLSYTSGGGNGKWSTAGYIQPNGAGSTTKRVFSFTAPKSGTVTVHFSNTGDNSARYVNVNHVGGTINGSVGSTNVTSTSEDFTVSAGTVKIYPTGGLRFYSIEYVSN